LPFGQSGGAAPLHDKQSVQTYTFEDLNPHAIGVLFISFKGNVADK